nr:AAA family ATPase [Marinibacterium profundimaris]
MTGALGAGKTGLATAFAGCGMHTVPESARAIIRQEMPSGGDALRRADRMASNGRRGRTCAPMAPHKPSRVP